MSMQVQTWTLVPKPRSAVKTVEWLPSLLKVEGKDWDIESESNVKPVRREYMKYAHPFDDFKEDDPEVNARMEFARYQTLGLAYLDKSNLEEGAKVVITPAGRALALQDNKDEIMLRQLLKWQFPSNIHSGQRYDRLKVFPLEIMLHVLENYGSVNRFEVAFSIFTCPHIDRLGEVYERIDAFRALVAGVPAREHKRIFIERFAEYNGDTGNKPETYLGNYDDTLFRYLEFTGIFETSGRGLFTRIYVPDRSIVKFEQLLKDYKFAFFENYHDVGEFYGYLGNPYANALPWDAKPALEEIIDSKFRLLEGRQAAVPSVDIVSMSHGELQKLDDSLTDTILKINEREFVERTSKTAVERDKIIEKFRQIEDGNEDLAALWMEVNTWKSLVAMNGDHYVKRNFRLELDLSPRSFAAGTNSTPDMEFYNQKYIIIPEVSIQSGVQQWITEGSSVVEHVYKFLEVKDGKQFLGIEKIEKYMNPNNLRAIYGLFIAQKLNTRLIWQFYVLSREAWMGEPISIVPLELSRYVEILEYMYSRDVPALAFEELIERIAKSSHDTNSYEEWLAVQDDLIRSFVSPNPAGV